MVCTGRSHESCWQGYIEGNHIPCNEEWIDGLFWRPLTFFAVEAKKLRCGSVQQRQLKVLKEKFFGMHGAACMLTSKKLCLFACSNFSEPDKVIVCSNKPPIACFPLKVQDPLL